MRCEKGFIGKELILAGIGFSGSYWYSVSFVLTSHLKTKTSKADIIVVITLLVECVDPPNTFDQNQG